ncbi:tryptophan-rich sensory protein [Sulfurifustis variabilis]|uniref:Tryptophan-rich sensory protein n=1 Tax=Sulfurifustis variabilis TaxID=1675686 RepID=A0A1B4V7H8_9GAMM|nr:TspO/MBR family protein [Sulfurifustis variabilis]BAU49483.1 tryptophan-rich sensory protein [Sulfurifustis variabilis]
MASTIARPRERRFGKATEALGFLAWIGLSFAAAAIGGLARPGAWYAALEKPAWTPPDAVFPPVWTTLYLLMGVAAGLVWLRRHAAGAYPALALFALQLALNALWSWLFFGWHLVGWALIEIAVLLVAILAMLRAFLPVSRVAGWLLAPYAAWVAYATTLNAAIWWLNP